MLDTQINLNLYYVLNAIGNLLIALEVTKKKAKFFCNFIFKHGHFDSQFVT